MPSQPNILLVFPDQLRGDWLGFRHREPVRTPFIDALARRGVAFTRAWTPSPICGPARACLATARDYARSPVQSNANDMPLSSQTIYRQLTKVGYRVATVGKLDLLKDAFSWGLDGQHAKDGRSALAELGFTDGLDSAGKHDAIRSFEQDIGEPYLAYLRANGVADIHARDFLRREPGSQKLAIADEMEQATPPPPAYACVDPTPLPEQSYCDNWIGQNAVSLLTELSAAPEPWFLTVNFAGPHEPLDVTETMRNRWSGERFSHPFSRPAGDAPLQQQIRRNYAAMIEVIDHWLGEMIKVIEANGSLKDTLVVFSSDHGEMLGDYNLWAKQVPFEASLNVPLVMAGPMIEHPDRQSSAPVSLVDLAATIVDVACARMPTDGQSLVPILRNEAENARRYIFSGLGNWRAVSDGRFKLVAGFDISMPASRIQSEIFDARIAAPGTVLYDIDEDPWETRNIASARPDVVATLWEILTANEWAVPLGPLK